MKKKKIVILICTVLVLLIGFVSIPAIFHAGSRSIILAIRTNDVENLREVLKNKKYAINHSELSDFGACLLQSSNRYPLQEACRVGNIEMVRLLIDNGADVNVKDSIIHSTPLLSALDSASFYRYEIAALLIEYGADINVFDDRGFGVLALAIHPNYTDIAEIYDKKIEFLEKVLPDIKDDSTHQTYMGYNVLENAAFLNELSVVKYLVEEKNYNVNSTSAGNTTALMYAAKNNSIDVCNYLLENGADKSLKDNSGKNAYDYAIENNFSEIAQLVESDN